MTNIGIDSEQSASYGIVRVRTTTTIRGVRMRRTTIVRAGKIPPDRENHSRY
jgi:hypothetical protein